MLITLIIATALLAAALCLFIGYQITFAVTMLHGPVFVPSADAKLRSMLKLARITKSSKVIDLGSGDGKVVIAIAQKWRIPVTGIEINPLLVRRSRKKIREQNLTELISIQQKSFWDIDFSEYDVIFLYGTSYIMNKLEAKVKHEMKPGSQVVSNFFTFPNLKPIKSHNDVHLYQL